MLPTEHSAAPLRPLPLSPLSILRAPIVLLVLALLAAGCGDDINSRQDALTDVSDLQDDQVADADLADADMPDTDMPTEPFCGDRLCNGDETLEVCPEDCDPSPIIEYEPSLGEITVFPDDYYTVEDSSTVTGLRVDVTEAKAPYILDIPEGFRKVFYDISELDGFGTSAGGFFTFTQSVGRDSLPEFYDTDEPGSPLFMAYEDDNGDLVRVPVDWLLRGSFEDTLVIRPLAPLPPGTRAVMGVTTGMTGRDGDPARANEVMASLLAGEATGDLAVLNERYQTAVQQVIDAGIVSSQDEIAAMTVFTTQSIVESAQGIADNIATQDLAVTEYLGCEDKANYRECSFTFEAAHYRNADRQIVFESDNAPQEIYELTAVVYLPLEPGQYGGPPYRTIIFGHGLNGSRTQARQLANFAAPRGMATLAIDAPDHGIHPVNDGNESLDTVLSFFGIALDGADIGVDSVVLRDSWQQASFDKLALLKVLGDGVDLDGDSMMDITTEDLTYLGASLGSIMGPQFLALTDKIGASVLIIGGGRVTDVIQLGDLFSVLVGALKPDGLGDDDVARFFVFLQTSIERGDSSNWARHVALERLDGAPPVQVLNANVLDDTIVPNVTNWVLARALGLPHVPPVLVDMGTLPVTPMAPISGNLPDGGTGGFMQFEWVQDSGSDTGWTKATHNNISDSAVGAEAWLTFLGGYLDNGVGLIVDPYAELGLTPP